MIKIVKQNNQALVDAQIALSHEMEATVSPLLKKLKNASARHPQTNNLVEILESNLQHVVKSYGYVNSLGTTYQKLSPIESIVASMVRKGFSTKVIADTLTISPGTVAIHRKHIRKKLGLEGKSVNLCNYLQSLTE